PGGAASDVRNGAFGLDNRLLVAGGGGASPFNFGAFPDCHVHGGDGGGLVGGSAVDLCNPNRAGAGGRDFAGGAGGLGEQAFLNGGPGSFGFGGTGSSNNPDYTGGGGGGGYYGGGGGAGGNYGVDHAGAGGGGSSYIDIGTTAAF